MSLPHVLIGENTSHAVVDLCRRRGWGRMWVFRNIRPIEGERWGFDNGAYKAWSDKNKGEKDHARWLPLEIEDFNEAKYLKRVERALTKGRPWLAVVPDLPGNGRRSLDFSLTWRRRLPQEWPLYLAVQDGMRPLDVRDALYGFAGIFLGGSPLFKKASAQRWAEMAREYGKRFHYARCSSAIAWRHAVAVGADSVDSSQPLWSNRLRSAWANTTAQQQLISEVST